jgi:hypothetical protein
MTKTTLDRLTTLGEEVLGRASQNPNLSRVVQGAVQLRDRVDELQKRVRGLEGLERRLAEVEGRLAKLERASRRPSATKKTDSKS